MVSLVVAPDTSFFQQTPLAHLLQALQLQVKLPRKLTLRWSLGCRRLIEKWPVDQPQPQTKFLPQAKVSSRPQTKSCLQTEPSSWLQAKSQTKTEL